MLPKPRVFLPQLPEQPLVVADMGCGDGTLLKTIYLYVKAETQRGRHLDEYPLTMCGVDFNEVRLPASLTARESESPRV